MNFAVARPTPASDGSALGVSRPMTPAVGSDASSGKNEAARRSKTISGVCEGGNAEIIKLKSVRPTIVLIERQALIRHCLSHCISSEIEAPVMSFPDVESWRESSDDLRPTLIIVGASNGTRHFVERAVAQLRRSGQTAPIMVFSDCKEIDDIADALRAGANGYVPLGTPLEIAVGAIRLVLAGGAFVLGDALLLREQEPHRVDANETRIIFSARQKAVLDRLCQGKTNRLIAYELNIGENTVKSHVHKIMKKLGLKKRADVVTRIGEDSELFE
jgi:DNA-binding NarL/FixJ family response regulator